MSSEILQAAKAYRRLLKAIKNHIGKEDYKSHFKEYVTQEFRKNRDLVDQSSIQQKMRLAHDYTVLLNSVHHHKELLFSYNIAVDRSDEMKKILGKSAASVEFWIDLLLTILGYIPGIISALFVLVG